jgi:hypothetical protein
VSSFAAEGIDIAFDETTPDNVFKKCVKTLETIHPDKIKRIKNNLIKTNKERFSEFMCSLEKRLGRIIEKIVIVPLYGKSNDFSTIKDAVEFIEQHNSSESSNDFRKYEVLISFSNGDRVEGTFIEKAKAKEFLLFVAKQ